MAGYPTPPPTSSPPSKKDTAYRPIERKVPAQDSYFEDSYSKPGEPKLPAQDSYYQKSYGKPVEPKPPAQGSHFQEPYSQPTGQKLPAQDSYYQDSYSHPAEPKLSAQDTYFNQSYSTPASPNHWDPSSKPVPTNNINAASTVHFDTLPPRRKSSPIQAYGPHTKPYSGSYDPFPRPSSTGVSPNTSPTKPFPPRKSSRTPPRPLYSSPLNPVSSPYNASRPQPRPGLLRRMAMKLEQWIRSFMKWSSTNPIKAGLLTFIPVLAVAGVVKAAKGIGKLFGGAAGGAGKAAGLKAAEKQAKKEWGYGLDEFVGFAGAKTMHPMGGLLKTVQMLVNHYCKLTPSSVPRLASILLELYFLDVGKAKV
ncbi:hypothetical protein N431DRAFT_488952 [Stipitochalara longipes BDJ]|nr:hypothetical protein N431DRAFT_488952 [Stipitochalara longipes BDJ]